MTDNGSLYCYHQETMGFANQDQWKRETGTEVPSTHSFGVNRPPKKIDSDWLNNIFNYSS